MKSAYELAMERLGKSDPSSGPLTAGQKARLAEIDRVYNAYPHLNDDDFVAKHRDGWLRG